MIRPVRPFPSEDDPSKAKHVDKADEEKKKIEKVREVDPEEKKRRKFRKALEEVGGESMEKTKETSKKPSPYQSEFYDKQPKASPKEKSVEEKSFSLDKGEKPDRESKEKEFPKKETQKEDFSSKEKKQDQEQDKIQKSQPHSAKKEKPMERSSKREKSQEHRHYSPKEKEHVERFSDEKEKKSIKPSQKEPSEEPIKQTTPPAQSALPIEVQQAASEITKEVTEYLNPTISPVFEKMVGHILVMKGQEGIVQTEIVLNNPEFESSVFYGATIVLEKYSTAPDSFNIQLIGNPQAVSIFNENLDRLTRAFQRGNFNFRIGRINAAYRSERPLYRRDINRKEGL